MAVAGESKTVAVDALFAGFESASAAETVAVFVTVPPATGAVTTSVIVAEAPLFSAAIEQVMVEVPLQVPGGADDTRLLPTGKTSVTVTDVAVAGPALLTTIV